MNTISEIGAYAKSMLMHEFRKKMIDKGYSNGSTPYFTCGYLKACLTAADYFRVGNSDNVSIICITQIPAHMDDWIDALPNIRRQQSSIHEGEMFV